MNKKRFKRIYIEISNVCNLTCSFCIGTSRDKIIMSLDNFEYIIKQIVPYTDYVYLHVMGEPLMHPQFKSILDICSEYNLYVQITTNGSLLKRQYDVLANSSCIRQINISVHSFPFQNDSKYLMDILDTSSLLADKMYISYRLWNLKDGKLSETSEVIANKIYEYYGAVKTYSNSKLVKNVYLNYDEQFTWPSVSNPFVEERGTCNGLKEMCSILSNGDVCMCCLDSNGDSKLGNIYSDSFKDIIESDKTNKILENMMNNVLCVTLCKHCEYRTRFNK